MALRVVGTRLDRDRDGLLVFFVRVVLFCVAAAVYSLTDLLVAAAPVVMLASRVTIAGPTSNATRRGVGQWGGAGGACCEDHFGLGGSFERARRSIFFQVSAKLSALFARRRRDLQEFRASREGPDQ